MSSRVASLALMCARPRERERARRVFDLHRTTERDVELLGRREDPGEALVVDDADLIEVDAECVGDRGPEEGRRAELRQIGQCLRVERGHLDEGRRRDEDHRADLTAGVDARDEEQIEAVFRVDVREEHGFRFGGNRLHRGGGRARERSRLLFGTGAERGGDQSGDDGHHHDRRLRSTVVASARTAVADGLLARYAFGVVARRGHQERV